MPDVYFEEIRYRRMGAPQRNQGQNSRRGPASSLVVNERQQDCTVFSVGAGIVLVCALPYKVLTASRTIRAELAHPLSLSLGPRQWFYQTAVTLE